MVAWERKLQKFFISNLSGARRVLMLHLGVHSPTAPPPPPLCCSNGPFWLADVVGSVVGRSPLSLSLLVGNGPLQPTGGAGQPPR
jgi:hypothetical protein